MPGELAAKGMERSQREMLAAGQEAKLEATAWSGRWSGERDCLVSDGLGERRVHGRQKTGKFGAKECCDRACFSCWIPHTRGE